MKRWATIRKHKVPYLPEKVIEEHAQLLLDEWAEAYPAVTEPPVPIEDILELHLGLQFCIADLQSELGDPDVLGGIWFGKREIKIDQSLDPAIHHKMLGRYRFTIAHEVGHWRLHRQHLMDDPSAATIFDANCEPAFVQRSNQNPREEIQANAFAAVVLMPRQLVYGAWRDWRGNEEPVAIKELVDGDFHVACEADQNMAMERFCKPLAERFEVSSQAMRIRLQKLNLLVEEIAPTLF